MKRIGIVGAGRFGQSLAEALSEKGAEVIILDSNRDTIQSISAMVAKAVQGDATNISVLQDAGFHDCDAVVVAIGSNMEGSIMATVNLKEMGMPVIIAKAVSDTHGMVLRRIGADTVIYPDRDRAIRLARSLLANTPIDYFEITEGISVAEITTPTFLIGQTLIDAAVRRNHGITILAIRRESKANAQRKTIIPTGEERIMESDVLLVFGCDKDIETFSKSD